MTPMPGAAPLAGDPLAGGLFIAGVGLTCPVGLSAASACAAKRAGLSALQELRFYDNAGGAIIGAAVPGLDPTLAPVVRQTELMLQALGELVQVAPPLDWQQVPLLLCLAEPERPGVNSRELAQSIIQALPGRLGLAFHPGHSRIFPCGQVAGFNALQEAARLMGQHLAPACVVAGVDSLLNAQTLQWLDQNRRLKTTRNRDGLSPGEGAAAVLLQPQHQAGSSLVISGVGLGQEEAPLLSGKPLRANGLTAAARAALTQAGLGLQQIDLRLSDVTGEQYGFKELPLMQARLLRTVRKQDQPLWHWAEAIGDSGAMAAIAQLILAEQAFAKGYAPGSNALCLASAVGGARAAAVLRALPGSGGGQ